MYFYVNTHVEKSDEEYFLYFSTSLPKASFSSFE